MKTQSDPEESNEEHGRCDTCSDADISIFDSSDNDRNLTNERLKGFVKKKTVSDRNMNKDSVCTHIPDDLVQQNAMEVLCGYLNSETCKELSHDCNYRLRNIIEAASKRLFDTGNTKLTSEDLKKVFFVEYPELCLNSSGAYDEILELDLYNRKEMSEEKPMSVHGEWFQPFVEYHLTSCYLSEAHQNYFSYIIDIALEDYGELFNFALNDLQTNYNIMPLLPYFVSYVSDMLEKKVCHILQLRNLLKIISALYHNQFLFINEEYMSDLIKCVLFCIFEPLPATFISSFNHWQLRRETSFLLAEILERLSIDSESIYKETLSSLKSAFKDVTKPFYCHYGVLIALRSYDIFIAAKLLHLHLPKYFKHLYSVMHSSFESKKDAFIMFEELLVTYEILIRYVLRHEYKPSKSVISRHSYLNVNNPGPFKSGMRKKNIFPLISSINLSEYFGDALFIRLPIQWDSPTVRLPPRNVNCIKSLVEKSCKRKQSVSRGKLLLKKWMFTCNKKKYVCTKFVTQPLF